MHKIHTRVGLPSPRYWHWLPFGTWGPDFPLAASRHREPGLPSQSSSRRSSGRMSDLISTLCIYCIGYINLTPFLSYFAYLMHTHTASLSRSQIHRKWRHISESKALQTFGIVWKKIQIIHKKLHSNEIASRGYQENICSLKIHPECRVQFEASLFRTNEQQCEELQAHDD